MSSERVTVSRSGWVKHVVEVIDSVSWVQRHAVDVAQRVHRDTETHIRGAMMVGTGGGGVSDPTGEAAVVAHPDPRFCSAERLNHLGSQAEKAMRALQSEMRKALAIPMVAAEDLASRNGVPCSNPVCRSVVAGTQDHRLRGDRCEPCYRYWLRSDKKQERPLKLVLRDVGTNGGDK